MFTLIAVLILAGGVLLFVELFVPGMIAGVCGGRAGVCPRRHTN
jgi:hypothetical protein